MLYWVYEEIERTPKRNIEFFNGLCKTEGEAQIFCERKNSILSSIAEKEVDVYKYREVEDSLAERFCYADTSILECGFFNASVIFSQHEEPYVSVWDDGIKQPSKITYNLFNNTITVDGSYPLGYSKKRIINKAKTMLDNKKK